METTPALSPAVAAWLAADLAARFFRGLADPCRVQLLDLLLDGPRTVSELVARTGLAQNRVSMHLACLRTCGFVTARREGRRVIYQVTDPRIREILRLARGVIAENAARILTCQVVNPEAPTAPPSDPCLCN